MPFFPFQPYTSPSQAQPSTLMRPFWTETWQTVCGGALNPPSCPSPLPFPPHQPALLDPPSEGPLSLPYAQIPPHMQPNPVLTSHTRLCAAETYGICAEQPILPNNNTSHEYLPFTPFLLPPSFAIAFDCHYTPYGARMLYTSRHGNSEECRPQSICRPQTRWG